MNKKDKKDCVNAVYKTNKPIEYCPSCMVKLTPTQFTINIISTVMKTVCVCGLAIEITPKVPLPSPEKAMDV